MAAATFGRSIVLRWVCLKCARWGGRLKSWLSGGWRKLALLYITAAILVYLYHGVTDGAPTGLRAGLRWFFHGAGGPWVVAIALAALIAAAIAAQRMRQRTVILAFVNLTGDQSRDALAQGLPRRLMTYLSEITEIYAQVSDDPRDLSPDQGKALPPHLAVGGAASPFAGLKASIKDQKVQVGPISIPVDWAVTTLSTLLQGPQISGTVQKTSEGLLIEASVSGGGLEQTWRVTEPGVKADRKGGDSEEKITDDMIQQLAYRVFTHFYQDEVGTPLWRAAERYTEGLRAFRQAQREKTGTSKRVLALQRAQQGFFRAYREDSRFVRSRYNLGVIYSSQSRWEPAFEVFQAVINDADGAPASLPGSPAFERARQDLASAHYAAAKAAQQLEYFDRIDDHCDMALALVPWHAAAWNLKGVKRFTGKTALQTRPYFRNAAAVSWIRLCRSEWSGRSRSILISQVVTHVANLANSYAGGKRSLRVMAQALELDPSNADNRVELGKLCLAAGDVPRAVTAFETANQYGERARHWFWVACAKRLLGEEQPAKDAWSRAKENAAREFPTQNDVSRFWVEFRDALRLGPIPMPEYKDWEDEASQMADGFAKIQAACDGVAQGKAIAAAIQEFSGQSAGDGPQDDETKLKKAIEWLEENYDKDIAARRLGPSVALRIVQLVQDDAAQRSRLKTDHLDAALRLALKALNARPIGALERSLLARVYALLNLQDLATDEVRNALIFEPGNWEIQSLSAQVALLTFQTVTDKQVRRKALRGVVKVFRDLADFQSGDFSKLKPSSVGWAHYWLATFSLELLDFPTAQRSFETSFACRYMPAQSLQLLCLVHFRCGAFEEAESAYRRLEGLWPADNPEAKLKLSKELRDLGEEKPPAFSLAWAANGTAAAMAEQGLVAPAMKRWRAGRIWKRRLQKASGLSADDQRFFNAGMSLCLGLILLSSARTAAAIPGGEKRIRLLRRAIRTFTWTVGFAADTSVRADAFYYMGVGCSELARLDAANAAVWRLRGTEALLRAEAADRRDEYAERIRQLRPSVIEQSGSEPRS